ncbi:glycosyltransferase family 4 protein [Cytobacillus pseudoceanisediminis]|uniref:glycosyltransferase family 4 protein n=1 Tax=Cytobacillus pseudoceanisediminis TaxID=3051614 RepID=UPI003C2D69CC
MELLNLSEKNNGAIGIKVLFTYYIPSGGIETLNRQRFYSLSKAGVTCHFLYKQNGTGLQNKLKPVFVLDKEELIRELVIREKYDAIIVASDLQMLENLKKWGVKSTLIYEVQGLGFYKEYAEKFIKTQAFDIVNNFADGILYPKTPHLIDVFEKYFPNKKKFCFHNCFNSKSFHYKKLPAPNNPILGWVGRLEENKNWKDFLAIGSKLSESIPNIQLWMFEDDTLSKPESRKEFENMVSFLKLINRLTIYPNQPHSKMADYFSMIGDSGGLLCSTSKVEGFGYAVLEAMVCRCPVLTTDSDGVRSFIIHNHTGKYYKQGDINHAIQEAKMLLTNAPIRNEIRRNGVEHIEKIASPEIYAANFLSMLNRLKKDH